MSKIVIDRDVAEKDFKKLCDFWDIDIDNDEESKINKEKVISAIMRGRIIFDETQETISYKLRTPIILENGEDVQELILKEPGSESLISKSKDPNVFLLTQKMIADSSGLPLSVISRLLIKDLTLIGCLMVFFD